MAGRKIDDHSFFVGGKSEGSVLPAGVKAKDYSAGEGAGALNKYEDSAEAVKDQQMMGKGKMQAHQPKAGYRN